MTAADYNQYSWDGDVGGAFTDCYIGSVKSGACDQSPYGNGDSYATFMEMFNYAVAQDETHGDGNPSSDEYTMPQCTNTAVLSAVTFGWVGKEEPSGVRFAPIPEQSVAVGETLNYTLVATNRDGSAGAIAYSIASATAPAGTYSLDGDAFSFTPATDGSFSFNFVATNATAKTGGKATMTVTAELAAPAGLSNSGITASSFTANWGAVAGAASYVLEVFAADEASPKAADSSFQLVTSADDLTEGEYVILGENADVAMNNTCSGASSGYLGCTDVTVEESAVSTDDASIIWTLAGDAGSCTLFNAAAGKFANPATSKSVGWSEEASGAWTLSLADGLVTADNAKDPSWTLQYNSSSPRFMCYSSKQKLLRFFRRDGASSAVFAGDVGNVTSFTVTDLIPGDYTWRVRAIGNAKGPFSEVQEVSLVADPSAPPSIRAIADIEIKVGETASAAVKVSAPEEAPVTSLSITAGDAAAKLGEDGVFSFAPEAVGVYPFTITAVNANGSAEETFTVTATLAAPVAPEATAVDSDAFTATWTAIPGAESYELVVIEGKGGSSGGGGSGETLTETFDGATFTPGKTTYEDQTIVAVLGTWTATECQKSTNTPARPVFRYAGTLTSPEIASGVSAVEFDYSWPYKESVTADVDLYVNGMKVDSTSLVGGTPGTASYSSFAAVSGPATVEFLNKATDKFRIKVDQVRITTAGAKGIAKYFGDVIYSNNVGNVMSFEVTGLQPLTEYTFAFRAIAGEEATEWSDAASVTTTEGPAAPAWAEIPAQAAAVGYEYRIDLSAYVSGSPTPTLTLVSGEAEFSGTVLSFTPAAEGSYSFTVSAANGVGESASVTFAVAASEHQPTKYAVCVGINKYKEISGLSGCVNDSQYMANSLIERGGWNSADVTLLNDSKATKSAIRSAISNVAAKAAAGDTFVYQHSSHGGQFNDTTGEIITDESGKAVFLCVYDEDYDDNKTAYNDYEMAADLAAFPAGVKVVVIVDACHSGGLFKSKEEARAAAASFDLAGRVTAIMDADRAQRKARGENVAKTLASSEIGWATACEYYETSYDGGFFHTDEWLTDPAYGDEYWNETTEEYNYPSSYKQGGVFTASAMWGWWNGTADADPEAGDNDGFCDAYEFWKQGYDFCSKVGEFWWDEPEYNYYPQCTNIAVLKSVELGWVVDTRLPAPENPEAPEAAVTATSFTASWEPVENAESYNLYVQQKVENAKAAESTVLLEESFEGGEIPAGWSASATGVGIASGKGGDGDYCVKFTGSGAWLVTPAVENPETLSLMYMRSKNQADWSLDIAVGKSADGPWETFDRIDGAATSWQDYFVDIKDTGTCYFKFTDTRSDGAAERYVDLVTVTGSAGTWVDVPGYSPANVEGTSKLVEGLEMGTEYRFSVTAVDAGDTESAPSEFVTVTTAEEDSAPVWKDIPEQSAVVGQEFTFDAADYVKAVPAATITLLESTAAEADYLFENGYLVFTPSAEGTFTFSLKAENGLGDAPATLTVAVGPAPVTVPELTLSNPTATTFDADWTACTGATNYQFQVATDDQFTPASAGGAFTLVTSVDGLVAGEYVILADGTDCAMNGTCSGASSGYLSCEDVAVSGSTVDTEEASIIWTLAGDASSCTLFNAAAGKYVNPATTKSIGWADTASGSWTLSVSEGVVTVANSANPSWKLQYNSGSPRFTTYDSNQKKLRFFRRDSRAVSKDGGSLVLDETMAELGCTVQNLEPETTYYARVRMADGEWSVVESISTEADVPSAPAWSDIPPQTVAVQEDLVVDLTAYVSGSPKPTITADAGTVENGVLTVSFAEAGDYTITLTASNSEGDASATLAVTVTAAPVTVPELALSNPQANSFDASWTACTGATSYQLQVATDDQFTAGGSGEATELFNNTAQTLDAPEGWTYAIDSASGKYLHLVSPENSIVSEAVSTKGYSTLSLDFRMRTYGGAAAPTALVEYSADGGDWTKLGTATAEANSLKPVSVDATACAGLASVKFRWTCPDSTGSVGVGVDKLVLSASGAGEGGSLVLDETLEDLVFAVTGLEPETTYYARVRMADGEWSAVENIKTQADVPSAPEWKEIPEQTAIVGQEFVLDLSSYVTGSPFPTITVDGAVAEGGNWSFTPEVEGSVTFELVATNTEGSDSTTLTVVVSPAPAAKYALCVGLNEYDYAAWAAQGWGIDKLKGCVNDATYMKKNLTERGGWAEADVTLLTDATATKEALRGAIAAVAAKAKAGDTFVYQHSSHGLNNKDLESDEYTKNVALATYAAPYEDFELAEDLEAFADGVKVVIAIDACHSAGMFKGAAKAGSFDIAARVSALMDANRTARKARGEDVSRNLTSDQVGWVTAADFDESSKDGGYYDTDEWMLDEDAEGEESGGTFLSSFTWGWWSGKADVSGEGDGDGWFDAYEGWSFATPVCADYDHTPQFLNPDVLRSVKLGWVGDTAPSAAIVFDPVPGVSVAIGEEATLTVMAKNADGTTDGITLSIVATDPEGLEYTFADGTLTFTPEEDGIFLFTVRALSGRTSATKLLGVTAALPAPVALEATDITESGFTANWTGVDAAQSYQLQVSTTGSFPIEEPDTLIEEGFDGVTSKDTLPEEWAYEGTFGTYPSTGGEDPPSIKLSKNDDTLTTPAFKLNMKGGLMFWVKGNGSGTNMTSVLKVEQLVGEDWLEVASFVPSTAAKGETKQYENVDKNATRFRFVLVKPDGAVGNIAIDDVKVLTLKANAAVVVDEEDIDGDATSFAVEGLKSGTTYHYRVRAIGNSKSAWSEVKEVTTSGEVAIPVPELTVGTSETNPDTAIYAIWLCDGVSKIQLQVASDAEFGAEFLVYDEEVSDLVGVVSGLTPETTYYVRARALVGERVGEWSEVQSVTTAAGGGEPEEPVIGGEEMADFELASVDSVTGRKSIRATATGKLATDYNSVKLEWAVKVVDGAWDFDQHEAKENKATYPEIDFDYPEGDFAIMRFVFE